MGKISFDNQAEPSDIPSSGNTYVYVDSTDLHLKQKDDTGKVIDVTQTTVLSWLESVKAFYDPTSSLPSSPSSGDRYIASATANGWVTQMVYEYNGVTWDVTIPVDGSAISVTDPDPNQSYIFDGTVWQNFGTTTSHNSLTGIQGGTTAQYYHLTTADYAALTDANAQLTALHTDGTPTFGVTTLGDSSQMASSAAPTSDADIANKKYVDDAVSVEDLWDKNGTVLHPKTAGDSVFIYEGANPICKLWDGDGNDAGTLSLFTGTTQYVHFSADEDSWITGGSFGIGDDDPTSDLHVRFNYPTPATTVGLTLEQVGAGDCVTHYYLTGGQRFDTGIDNSTTNDDFVIGSGNFGTKYLSIDTSTNTVTVSNLSGTLANGVTATTQSAGNDSTLVATTAYVDDAVSLEEFWQRAGTTISPKTAGDNITTTGDITGANLTGDELDIISTATTTRPVIVTANSLTTAPAAYISSSSADASARYLLELINSDSNSILTGGITIDNNGGGSGFDLTNENTTLDALDVDCDSLTTGGIANFKSNSGDTNARDLVTIHNDNALATGTTCLSIIQDSTGLALNTNGNITAGSYDGVLNDGVTGTTQSTDDNSTKIATTAYVDAAVLSEDFWDRSGTVITPKTAGDDIATTGDISVAGASASNGLFQPVYPDDEGLILNLPFKEVGGTTQYDRSSYANNCTIVGTAAVTATGGLTTSGLVFQSTLGYIDIPDMASGTFDDGITMEVWSYPTATNSFAPLFTIGNGASGNNIWIERWGQNTALRVNVQDGTSQLDGIDTGFGTYPINEWTHVIVTITKAGAVKTYINGKEEASGTVEGINAIARTVNYLGYRDGISSAQYYNGSMANPKLYKRVLNPIEAKTAYLRGHSEDSSSVITSDEFKVFNTSGTANITVTSKDVGDDILTVKDDTSTYGALLALDSESNNGANRSLLEIDHSGTGGATSAIDINLGSSNGAILQGSSSNTTLPGLRLDCNDLTYGAVAHFASSSTDTNIRKLVHIQNASALSTGTTGLVIDQASTGKAISTNGDITAGAYAGTELDIVSTATTTRPAIITANSLTTAPAVYISSSSSDASERYLLELVNNDVGSILTGGITIDNNGGGPGLDLTNENTTLDAIDVDCDSLTTGGIASFKSNSGDTSSRDLMTIHNDNTLATGTVGLNIIQDSTGKAITTNGNITAGSYDGVLNDGVTATTQSPGDNTTKVATTAFVVAEISAADLWDRTGTILSPATAGDNITTTGDLTAANITAGSNLGISQSGITNLVVGNTTGKSKLYFGQATNTNLVIEWTYDATPADASARITTWGYANDFYIDAKVLSLQTNNSTGQVGIGTDDPQAKLDVRGNIRVGDWVSADVSIFGAPASGGDFNIGQTSGAGKIKFVSNAGTDLVTIENGGDVGIGITTPSEKLEVNGTVKATAFSGDTAVLESSVYQGVYGSQDGQVLGIDFSEVGSTTQYDKGPLANNATGTSAGLVTSTGGRYGSGAVLNGTTDYFTLANSTGLPTGAAVRTMEALVKIDDITLQDGVIFRYGTETEDDVFALEQDDAAFRIFTNNDSSYTGNILAEGNWYLIQVTYSGTQINMWVNGEKVITNDAITVNTASGTTPYIGSRGGSSDYFDGNIAFVKVYDRVLEDDELSAHYLRSVGDTIIKSNEAKVINTSNEIHNIAGYDPAYAVDVFSLSDLPTAVTGVITLEAKMYNFHNIIVFSDRLVIPDNATTIFNMSEYGFNTYLLYTGTGTFITGAANAGLRILNASIGMTGTGAKCFDVNGTVGMDFLSIICLGTGQTLGTLAGEAVSAATGDARFVARRSDFTGYTEGFTLTNLQVFVIDQVNLVQNASSTSHSIKIAGALSLPSTISAAGIGSAASGSCFDISPIIQNQVSIKDAHNSGSGDYFTTRTTGTFTAVADASVSAEAITSVTDSSGVARFNFSAPPTLFVNQEVVISGFTTNTAYNGTYIITATGTNYFEVYSIDYGSDETGSFLSNSVTLTDTGTSLSDGDEISLDTNESTAYDTGSYVYNKQTNSVQVNKTWTATATGTWNSGSLTQDSKYIDAQGNGDEEDSHNSLFAYVNTNTTTTTFSLSNTWYPVELGTVASGVATSRFKYIGDNTFKITTLSPLMGVFEANLSGIKSGSDKEYDFRINVTSGTGSFDSVIKEHTLTSGISSFPVKASGFLQPGDEFQIEARVASTSQSEMTIAGFNGEFK
ncbi:MAG: LamG domain-containing protein [bacterium]|nr:LamG domain-containing protein [bacterium]